MQISNSEPILEKKHLAELDKLFATTIGFDPNIKLDSFDSNPISNDALGLGYGHDFPENGGLFLPDQEHLNYPGCTLDNHHIDLPLGLSQDPVGAFGSLFDNHEESYIADFLSNLESDPLSKSNNLYPQFHDDSKFLVNNAPYQNSKNNGKEFDFLSPDVNLLSFNGKIDSNSEEFNHLHMKNFLFGHGNTNNNNNSNGNSNFGLNNVPAPDNAPDSLPFFSDFASNFFDSMFSNPLPTDVVPGFGNSPSFIPTSPAISGSLNDSSANEAMKVFHQKYHRSALQGDVEVSASSISPVSAPRSPMRHIPIRSRGSNSNVNKNPYRNSKHFETSNDFELAQPLSFEETALAKRQFLRRQSFQKEYSPSGLASSISAFDEGLVNAENRKIQNLKRTAPEFDASGIKFPSNLSDLKLESFNLGSAMYSQANLTIPQSGLTISSNSLQNNVNDSNNFGAGNIAQLSSENSNTHYPLDINFGNIQPLQHYSSAVGLKPDVINQDKDSKSPKIAFPTHSSLPKKSTISEKNNLSRNLPQPNKKIGESNQKALKSPDSSITISKDQKRLNHIESERRRRNYIKSLFDELTELVSENLKDGDQVQAGSFSADLGSFDGSTLDGISRKSSDIGILGSASLLKDVSKPTKSKKKKSKRTKVSKATIIEAAVLYIENLQKENLRLR
ncbi:hypothetical protein AYI68_g3810 [Smittium mucronatum]|uniref:BHLH domain-containing protein n=1 Tax=Smittium mucronatum TaxID=133383 RepID=A0A1R0GZ09_9FUNG|nr:hypothetical protein AYI68_g8253 [Smittium mucronatum]OLY82078.1 hypothetical protein AYI68_g3810 [Smittium mucronatum]